MPFPQYPKKSQMSWQESLTEDLISANTRFAFNIFKQLILEDKDRNIFISPLSILLALAMTYNGAAGETALGMADAMEFAGMDMEELNRGFSDLMISILSADKSIELSIANSIQAPKLGLRGKRRIDSWQRYGSCSIRWRSRHRDKRNRPRR